MLSLVQCCPLGWGHSRAACQPCRPQQLASVQQGWHTSSSASSDTPTVRTAQEPAGHTSFWLREVFVCQRGLVERTFDTFIPSMPNVVLRLSIAIRSGLPVRSENTTVQHLYACACIRTPHFVCMHERHRHAVHYSAARQAASILRCRPSWTSTCHRKEMATPLLHPKSTATRLQHPYPAPCLVEPFCMFVQLRCTGSLLLVKVCERTAPFTQLLKEHLGLHGQ